MNKLSKRTKTVIELITGEPYNPLYNLCLYQKKSHTERIRTLTGWIRKRGGLNDPSLRIETDEFRELINRKTGRAWDDLIDEAIGDGWLSLGSNSDELRELVREDILARKFRLNRIQKWMVI